MDEDEVEEDLNEGFAEVGNFAECECGCWDGDCDEDTGCDCADGCAYGTFEGDEPCPCEP